MKVANSSQRINKTCKVSFEWKAPELGDFAYADGTFTSSYDATKTMIGLVYAKDVADETSGTVYIIGKEYAHENP
nr:MAG TPA: Gastric inhibitory polypeptide [Bacteriophage sp.]